MYLTQKSHIFSENFWLYPKHKIHTLDEGCFCGANHISQGYAVKL